MTTKIESEPIPVDAKAPIADGSGTQKENGSGISSVLHMPGPSASCDEMSWTRAPNLLQGIRLLEIGGEMVSFCGKLLVDLGAEVVKVDHPVKMAKEGRTLPGSSPSIERNSPYFLYHNRNKPTIALDVEQPAGRELFLKLAADADAVIAGLPTCDMERLGLGYGTLSAASPGMVMASITGFGSSGPLRDWRSCDLIAAASGGQLLVNGSPGRPPLQLHGPQALYLAALNAAFGIVLALIESRTTGRGDYVEISLQEAVASSLDHVLVRYLDDGTVAERTGGNYWNQFCFVAPCKDGHIVFYPFQQWETLVEWMEGEGMSGGLAAEDFSDPQYRRDNLSRVVESISRWTAIHTRADLFETGQLMGLPWGPVLDLPEVLSSPQLADRGFFATLDEECGGCLEPRPPYRFAEEVAPPGRRTPTAAGLENGRSYQGEPALSDENHRSFPASGGLLGLPMPRSVLDGLTVLDFTRVLAGPFATRLLADFGAEVIKVQSERCERPEANEQPYFRMWNRNKKGIAINMDCPEARGVVLELVARCDVLVENFSPRVFENWGLDYATLTEANPSLILLRMSAAGQSGPWKNSYAFGPTIHALCGLTQLTSYTEGPPVGPGIAHADVVSGLYGALAVAAALYHRRRTGGGQYIDLSEYEAMTSLLGPSLIAASKGISEVPGQPEAHEGHPAAPYGCFPCLGNDRWCAIAVFDDAQWRGLCGVLGMEAISQESQFTSMAGRRRNIESLHRLVEEKTRLRHAPELAEALQSAGVPAALVHDAKDLTESAHLLQRGFFVRYDHRVRGGRVGELGGLRLGSRQPSNYRPAPALGEDTEEVFYRLLGWSAEMLGELRLKGVIG